MSFVLNLKISKIRNILTDQNNALHSLRMGNNYINDNKVEEQLHFPWREDYKHVKVIYLCNYSSWLSSPNKY